MKAPADLGAFNEPKWVAFNRIENFKLSGRRVFDGQGTTAYKRECCKKHDYCDSLPINLRFDFLTNAMVQAPGESPNTDGIHIGRSDWVNVLNTEIKTGDDCVSIGDGSKNLVINGVTCGPGHGISIGSLELFKNEEPVDGVTNQKFARCCSNIHFEDTTVTNVSSPIIIDQKYCPWNKCKINEESKVKLSNINFKNIHGTSVLPEAVKIICSVLCRVKIWNLSTLKLRTVDRLDLQYHNVRM
ncbi:hypothetical protein GOBAR_DD21872 [Gossypium barbadense]|nr:hypothetical protein GOBAR_DD21872 [Gossypium barbadense]